MTKQKKTISVQYIKEFANEQLNNPNNTIEEKIGIMTMIEEILHKSNAYKGFMYTKIQFDKQPPKFGTDDWACRKYF